MNRPENKFTIGDLRQRQSLPLSAKIQMTKIRIRAWVDEYGEDGVYISFSGGKDSTVLLDLVRNECGYKNVPAVFVDVPTQYPELREFAKTFENVEILHSKLSFMEVCEKYGFPLISKEVAHDVAIAKNFKENPDKYKDRKPIPVNKDGIYKPYALMKLEGSLESNKPEMKHLFNSEKWLFLVDAPFYTSEKCCNTMKKDPLKEYEKRTGRVPITGTMACESRLRTKAWLLNGCNAFNAVHKISNPMSFWKEEDVLQYILEKNLKICEVYGEIVEEKGRLKIDGLDRTGCMLCGFGCQIKGDERFIQLKETHPKMYGLLDVCKNNGVTFREAIEWTNEHGNLNIKL